MTKYEVTDLIIWMFPSKLAVLWCWIFVVSGTISSKCPTNIGLDFPRVVGELILFKE
jgi:hypothetical protein